MAEIPEQEYGNLATNCVIILNSLLKERSFTNDGTVEERAARYEAFSDPLNKFLRDSLVKTDNPNDYVVAEELRRQYWNYADCNKIYVTKMAVVFGRSLSKLGIKVDKQRVIETNMESTTILKCYKWKGEE